MLFQFNQTAYFCKNNKPVLMKKIVCFFVLTIVLIACKDNESKDFAIFGETINSDDAVSKEDMFSMYKNLKKGDTLNIAFISKSKDVCQSKGCWMTMDLGNEAETFVKFKDYAFFVPKNGQNKETVVKGKAYISIETVDELKHYAKDAGKSQASIDSISEPKISYSFMADGVLMAK